MKKLLTYATFPVIFFGGMFLAAWGLALELNHAAIVSLISVGAAVLIALLERIHPYEPDWNQSRGDVAPDAIHLVVSVVAVPELLKAFTFAGLYALGAWLSGVMGFGLWPHHWPLWLQVTLAMLIAEFGAYWAHRLMHEYESLWRLHATHHSAPRLYWLNAARFHPLDVMLQYLGYTIPLVLMGCSPEVLLLFTVFTSLHGMFQHANIEMRLGPLNWVFSMAELHRWHHSTLVVEGNANYGANLIFWDIVFRTRFLPSDRKPPSEIGIQALPHFPKRYLDHLLSPFQWQKITNSDG